jgi:hypothetical protein
VALSQRTTKSAARVAEEPERGSGREEKTWASGY